MIIWVINALPSNKARPASEADILLNKEEAFLNLLCSLKGCEQENDFDIFARIWFDVILQKTSIWRKKGFL